MKYERFDPRKMQEILDKLRAEGRLPSEEAFVEAAMRIRAKYREKVVDALNQDKRRPRKD